MPVCPKCSQTGPEEGTSCPNDDYYFVAESVLEEAEFDRRIGTLVGERFVVLDRISEGGMGAVYRAMQLPVRRQVALKVLRAELEQSHKVRKRFVREARAISQLSHPNIITLHDFGFDDYDQPYMVMEYAPGKVLSDWARSQDMTTRRLIEVSRQLISALADAHERGIVHRDLKPQNVIVTRAGQNRDFPKLLDFGIARLVNKETTQGLTADGEVFGTPHYMSPEQARGAAEVGPASDVYAMGVMLYECVTGEVPFDADTPLSVLFMHINEPMPEPVCRQGLDLPGELTSVILQATEKSPEDRFADAGQLLSAFDDALGLRTDTGSLSISGQFPSTAHSEAAESDSDPKEADDVSTAPTMMLSGDDWSGEKTTEQEDGDTLQSHQLDESADAGVSDSEAADEDCFEPREPNRTSPQTPTARSEEGSSPIDDGSDSTIPAGLVVAVVAVCLAVVVAGAAVIMMVASGGSGTREGDSETEHQVAQAVEGETEPPGDAPAQSDGAQKDGQGEEADFDNEEASQIDEGIAAFGDEDGESEHGESPPLDEEVAAADSEQDGDSGGAERVKSIPEPTGAPGRQESGDYDRGASAKNPDSDRDDDPAEIDEIEEEEAEQEQEEEVEEIDEADDSPEALEPGKFDRPDDDGPAKFERPGQ